MTSSISQLPIIDYLGPTPCNEECADIGEDDFARLNRIECRAHLNQLNRLFPVPDHLKEHVGFAIQTETGHEYGYYREVVIRGTYNTPGVSEFVAKIKPPTNWDNKAKVQLATGWEYQGFYTDASPVLDLEKTVTVCFLNADSDLTPIHPDELEQRTEAGEKLLLGSNNTPYRRVLIHPQQVDEQLQQYRNESANRVWSDEEWVSAQAQLASTTEKVI